VHFTFDVRHQSRPNVSWAQVAEALGPEVLANRAVLLQRGQSAALLHDGRQLASWDAEQGNGPVKLGVRLLQLAPCCIVVGQPTKLLLSGLGLGAPDIKLHARYQGRFLELQHRQVQQPEVGEAAQASSSGSGSGSGSRDPAPVWLELELEAVPSPGLVWIEVEQQHLISRPQPLLVLPDAEMAAELLLLQRTLAAAAGMSQVGWGVWVEEGEGLRCQLPCALLINAMFEGTRAEIAARSPHPSLTSARAHPTPLAGAAGPRPAAGPPQRVPAAGVAAHAEPAHLQQQPNLAHPRRQRYQQLRHRVDGRGCLGWNLAGGGGGGRE
jgi:hypothetical protein